MPTLDDVRRRAVLLSDDSVGVTTEDDPRKIQANGKAFYTTVSPSWLDQLNLAEQSAEVFHSLSLGVRPVIVQQPAVIVQPAELIEAAEEGRSNGRSEVSNPW